MINSRAMIGEKPENGSVPTMIPACAQPRYLFGINSWMTYGKVSWAVLEKPNKTEPPINMLIEVALAETMPEMTPKSWPPMRK